LCFHRLLSYRLRSCNSAQSIRSGVSYVTLTGANFSENG
jgi:hypothetical protein